MNKKLPKRPNLDHLRRQAKSLLARLYEGDANAARTFIDHLPEARTLTPASVRASGFRLADAQSAIARQTGFTGWPSLSRHVNTLKALEGTWSFESLEIDGAKAPGAAFGQSRILIDGDCFRTESPEGDYEGVFTIDVDSDPHWIDIEFVAGPEAGEWCRGLFKIDGDRVTFCLGLVGSSRPVGFATTPGSGHALETLRRVESARPAHVTGGTRKARVPPARSVEHEMPSVDASTFDAPITPMMKRLGGEWRALELVRDGEPMNDDWLAYGLRTTVGNEVKVAFGGQTMLHARMRIDEKARPISVDYLNIAGAAKGRVSLGIMEWTGDDVTFHVASPGKPRPTDFVATKSGGATLSRWRLK